MDIYCFTIWKKLTYSLFRNFAMREPHRDTKPRLTENKTQFHILLFVSISEIPLEFQSFCECDAKPKP